LEHPREFQELEKLLLVIVNLRFHNNSKANKAKIEPIGQTEKARTDGAGLSPDRKGGEG